MKRKRKFFIIRTIFITLLLSLTISGIECHVDSSDHDVSTPDRPSGPSTGKVNEVLTFTTGGSKCDEGDPVEYRFDFGDGTVSDWSSSTSASHSYDHTGTFYVYAQARCSVEHTVSNWSLSHAVDISDDKLIIGKIWIDENDKIWILYQNILKSPYKEKNYIFPSKIYDIKGKNTKNIFCCGEKSIFFYNGINWREIYRENTVFYKIKIKYNKAYFISQKKIIVICLNSNKNNKIKIIKPNNISKIKDIWIKDQNSFYLIEEKGKLLYYNGSKFIKINIPTQNKLSYITGNKHNLYIIDSKGNLFYYNGIKVKKIYKYKLKKKEKIKFIKFIKKLNLIIMGTDNEIQINNILFHVYPRELYNIKQIKFYSKCLSIQIGRKEKYIYVLFKKGVKRFILY